MQNAQCCGGPIDTFYYYIVIIITVGVVGGEQRENAPTYTMAHMWRSEGNFGEPVLSRTQVIRLAQQEVL